jgi:hypothetical protein
LHCTPRYCRVDISVALVLVVRASVPVIYDVLSSLYPLRRPGRAHQVVLVMHGVSVPVEPSLSSSCPLCRPRRRTPRYCHIAVPVALVLVVSPSLCPMCRSHRVRARRVVFVVPAVPVVPSSSSLSCSSCRARCPCHIVVVMLVVVGFVPAVLSSLFLCRVVLAALSCCRRHIVLVFAVVVAIMSSEEATRAGIHRGH